MEVKLVNTKTNETLLKFDVDEEKCNGTNSEVLRYKHRTWYGHILARHAFYNVKEAKVSIFIKQYQEMDSFSNEEFCRRLFVIGRPWVRQLPCWLEMPHIA